MEIRGNREQVRELVKAQWGTRERGYHEQHEHHIVRREFHENG